MDFVEELESHVSVDVHIDAKLHSRFIGFKGRTLSQIMKTYGVSVLSKSKMAVVYFDHNN